MSGLSRPLARLIAGQICLHACMAGTRMAAPLLALRDGFSEAAVGVLLALFALTPMFLALPAGRYVDRHGLKRPLAWSVVVASSGAALAVIWPVFPVLCLSALMTGGATGAAVIALQRHVGRMAEDPTQLRQVFSWLSIGPAISNFIGPLAAGLLIDHAGFRAAFALMAVLPLLCWWWVRRTREKHDTPAAASTADAAPRRAMDLLRDRAFRRLLMVNWVMASCWDVHTFVVPVLGHELGFSASVIGAILGSFAIAAASIRVVLPMVAAHVREERVIAGAMVVCAVVFAAYPFMTVALAMGLCSVLLGLALGCVQPMVMSTLHQITPAERHGEALGLRLMAINASSVLMPLLFGAVGAIVGIQSVFWAVGAVAGTGIPTALRMKPPRPD